MASVNGPTTPRPLAHKASASSLFKLGSTRKPLWSSHAVQGEATAPAAPSEKSQGFMQLLRSVSSASTRSAETAFGKHKKAKHEEDDREPFKSFLRVRPAPNDRANAPAFVQIVNDTEVKLHAPDSASANGILGMRTTPGPLPSTTFAFTRVFSQTAGQADFFRDTTLPLVQDVLDGSSGLLFAYGVSNSGKTYTVQGGPHTGEPGILPRAVDVIFNSIASRQSLAQVRPAKLAGVESIPVDERTPPGVTKLHSTDITAEAGRHASDSSHRDDTILPVADGFQYAVWVSYVEVYNEKIYDLLEQPAAHPPPSSVAATPNSSFSSMSLATLAVNNASTDTLTRPASGKHAKETTRKALSLKHDKEGGNKYISGATEVRVWSADDARAVMRKGQINRRVFGTLLNRVSSRSHGIFTIKIVRVPTSPVAGSANGVEHAASSRLCIVDLAGSERTRNTQTTGERLKEAGNINKSLMVLGQCLEVIRQNQRREKGKKPQQVPFRHSKLTELFQSFFLGFGRAAMVVCLNPYDTGYEESMHVMKFSAVAKDVTTSRPIPAEPSPVLAAPSTPKLTPAPTPTAKSTTITIASYAATPSRRPPLAPSRSTRENTPRAVALPLTRDSTPAPADEIFEDAPEHLSEGEEAEEEEDEEADAGVDYLFEEIAGLRVQLVEAEIEAAAMEARIRQEVVREFSTQMREMEEAFNERMQEAVDAAERKADLKINILTTAHNALQVAIRRPAAAQVEEESDEETEEEEVEEDDEEEEQGYSSADRLSASTKSSDFEMAQNSVVSDAAAPKAEIIDVDAEDSASSDVEPAPVVIAAPETSNPLTRSTRKATRKSEKTAAEPRTTKTPRKSRARPGAVMARIKAFEQVLSGDEEDEEVVLEVGRSPAGKKKRKLGPKAATTRELSTLLDDDDTPKTRTRASAGAALSKSSSSRTVKALR